MSINPDAHSTYEIDLTRWGVEISEWLLLRERSSAQATSLVKSWRKSLGGGPREVCSETWGRSMQTAARIALDAG